jgi:hypothetical protein
MVSLVFNGVLVIKHNFGFLFYLSASLAPAVYYFIAFRAGRHNVGVMEALLMLVGGWLIFDTFEPLPAIARGAVAFFGIALPFFIGQRLSKKPEIIEKVK